MKAKVRLTVPRRNNSQANLALSDCSVDLFEQFVPWLHGLVVQERVKAKPAEMVIDERNHCSFCVCASVAYEHVTGLHNGHNSPCHHLMVLALLAESDNPGLEVH